MMAEALPACYRCRMSNPVRQSAAPICFILQDRKRLPARFFAAMAGAVQSRLR